MKHIVNKSPFTQVEITPCESKSKLKVRIESIRATITIPRMSSLKVWQRNYADARLIIEV
jgi:hypothetical protein